MSDKPKTVDEILKDYIAGNDVWIFKKQHDQTKCDLYQAVIEALPEEKTAFIASWLPLLRENEAWGDGYNVALNDTKILVRKLFGIEGQ